MKRVLFVIPNLDHSGAARRLILLAVGLPRERFEVRVCVLGGPSPWSAELCSAAIQVETLGRSRLFDLLPFLALRRLLRSYHADVIHVWGASALRNVALLNGLRNLWVSAALPPVGDPSRIDAWMLRRVRRVVAFSAAEAGRYQALGVPSDRIVVVPPAAAANRVAHKAPDNFMQSPGSRAIVVVGPLRPHKGVREAIWSLDALHFVYPDLELVLVGDRPTPRELEGLPPVKHIHFVGPRDDVAPFLDSAEVVWLPGRAGGVTAALEAMAAGKPVVAARSPEMAEVIENGVSGYLCKPGDKAELARCTRRLLDEPDRRQAFGEAARRRVAERFTPAHLLARYVALLDGA